MAPTLRFSDLTPFGRAIIVIVGALTAAVALVAFATSYGALYALVRDTGLYSGRLSMAYPLLLDLAFVAAELAAILGGILRGGRGWPVTVMLIAGSLTIAFNIMHAMNGWADWTRGLIAALPPVMMILAFQVDLAIVAWVMRALGRSEQAFGEAGSFLGVPQMHLQMQTPSATRSRIGHFDQAVGGGEASKKAAIQAVAERLGPEEVTEIGAEGVAQYLADHHGIGTTPGYVRKVLEGRAGGSGRNGHGKA